MNIVINIQEILIGLIKNPFFWTYGMNSLSYETITDSARWRPLHEGLCDLEFTEGWWRSDSNPKKSAGGVKCNNPPKRSGMWDDWYSILVWQGMVNVPFWGIGFTCFTSVSHVSHHQTSQISVGHILSPHFSWVMWNITGHGSQLLTERVCQRWFLEAQGLVDALKWTKDAFGGFFRESLNNLGQ